MHIIVQDYSAVNHSPRYFHCSCEENQKPRHGLRREQFATTKRKTWTERHTERRDREDGGEEEGAVPLCTVIFPLGVTKSTLCSLALHRR
jgi:hypothetical protein